MADTSVNPTEPNPSKSTKSNNSKIIILAIGCVIVFGVCLFYLVEGSFHNSDVYKASLSEVQQNADVTAHLGTPIEAKYMISGNLSIHAGGRGVAKISYTVYGSKAEAAVYVEGLRQAGNWRITNLVVLTNTKKITLE